jgi:hypothetical protein
VQDLPGQLQRVVQRVELLLEQRELLLGRSDRLQAYERHLEVLLEEHRHHQQQEQERLEEQYQPLLRRLLLQVLAVAVVVSLLDQVALQRSLQALVLHELPAVQEHGQARQRPVLLQQQQPQ